MVWPENLGWRWGPSWDRQRAAAASGGRALLAAEQQRRKQLPAPLGVLVVEVVGAELEPRCAPAPALLARSSAALCCRLAWRACAAVTGSLLRCCHFSRPAAVLLPLPARHARAHRRRSTFLGRLKPVSSRVSLLLPAAAPLTTPEHMGGHAISSGAAAARAVLQAGLTNVQDATCRPCWQQSHAFVVSSRHQVRLQRRSQQPAVAAEGGSCCGRAVACRPC